MRCPGWTLPIRHGGPAVIHVRTRDIEVSTGGDGLMGMVEENDGMFQLAFPE